MLPAFQGGPPVAAKASCAQSGEAEWAPLLEVEEPLCLNGALPADWNVGPDLVSLHQNICPPIHTGTPLSIHSPHDVLCVGMCVRAAVTVCGSQEKKGMFRQGEGRGRQWHF